MSTLGERLKSARKRAGLTQAELAAKVPVKSGAIVSSWEQDTHMPNPLQIKSLCEALDVGADYLLDYYGGDDLVVTAADRELLARIHELDITGQSLVRLVVDHEYERCTRQQAANVTPLLTRPIRFVPLPVSAGTGVELGDEQTGAIDIPLTDVSRQADFVLTVNGTSMEPEFHDGDLLLIQQTEVVNPGELGVFAVNGSGYFKRAGVGQLESLNPDYAPIVLTDGDSLTTFGRVIGTTERVADGE